MDARNCVQNSIGALIPAYLAIGIGYPSEGRSACLSLARSEIDERLLQQHVGLGLRIFRPLHLRVDLGLVESQEGDLEQETVDLFSIEMAIDGLLTSVGGLFELAQPQLRSSLNYVRESVVRIERQSSLGRIESQSWLAGLNLKIG